MAVLLVARAKADGTEVTETSLHKVSDHDENKQRGRGEEGEEKEGRERTWLMSVFQQSAWKLSLCLAAQVSSIHVLFEGIRSFWQRVHVEEGTTAKGGPLIGLSVLGLEEKACGDSG